MQLNRVIRNRLDGWYRAEVRRPLLIDGARQVGKSYLVEKLWGPENFEKIHKFDFRRDKNLHQIFEESLRPSEIIVKLEVFSGQDIDEAHDLVFFDEIGECQGAIDSLKYFAEEKKKSFLIASGSNIGLLKSFPVGKVEFLKVYPMTFEEFVIAAGNGPLIRAWQGFDRSKLSHGKLWPLFLDYCYVGGMPEAVERWFALGEEGTGVNRRAEAVAEVHSSLVKGYTADFGKFSDGVQAMEIDAVFKSIPSQLQAMLNGDQRRFNFKSVAPPKKRYAEFRGPIGWLVRASLVHQSFMIRTKPKAPLDVLAKENLFRLYLFDIGLLGHMLNTSYRETIEQTYEYKGFFMENFVACELAALGMASTHFWKPEKGESEIEFLIKANSGEIYPLEVKSGKNSRSKSLSIYRNLFSPKKSVKLVGKVGGTDQLDMVVPLYYVSKLLPVLKAED